MSEPPGPLARATRLARADTADGPDWQETAGGVMRRVRSTVRPGRPVRLPPTDDRGSVTRVNERVVVTALRRAVAALDGVAPVDVRLDLTAEVCTTVHVELAARYGEDLHVAGERCRRAVRTVLGELLLDAADGIDVPVGVVDVVPGDPEL